MDNWKHRGQKMICETCMWFMHKIPDGNNPEEEQVTELKLGRCRRHSPTMNGFPAVFITDWCGDHKLDENKI